MSVHDETAENFALIKPVRPRMVRVVHVESERVIEELPIPDGMTLPEIEAWTHWIEFNAGPGFTTEIPGWESAA